MGSPICEAFGQNLRAIRKSKGFSQERLAHEAGVDRSYLGKVERGEVNITIEKIYLLAEQLQCAPSDLVPNKPPLNK
ncbi:MULTISPECIES: helix-turn-helix transcriptional regulator [Marinobacter]|uniref:helix-turn-helix domain-containing protein n=1 Tax=Marinobacter TaxID=2742 RepID=UPI0019079C8F|nr:MULTISPECIES: helix-turn-helix transcriptional regulator [Marinobacter]MBC7193730.1 helix-turn-helix transcriptional regulator [Marinobacter sp.]MBK1851119.1 helix-turn-helix transcriptional regulator [Marinobacter sp. 1-4A]MCK0162290.1 helix-turn-helix domain-containing protein [Marinobacter sp. S6332]MDM8181340.1 helix-turn-helix transcriptional regulator [Marinobacter salarius]